MGALISFLGGSAFRMVWGEVSAWLTARQNHKFELERSKQQGELDAAQHARELESIKTQHEIGVDTIRVQSVADLGKIEASAWQSAVDAVGRSVGIAWVDAWNAVIRPLLATCAILVMFQEIYSNHGNPTEHVLLICDAILGIYVADRSLAKRGK